MAGLIPGVAGLLVVAGLAAVTVASAGEAPVDTDERLRKRVHRHFVFWGQSALDRRDLSDLYRNLDDVRRDVGRDLDSFPGAKLDVVITEAAVFQEYSGFGGHVAGLFDGKIHIPVPSKMKNRDALKATLWHEYTHAVVWARTKGRCPRWLNEGLAEYQEAKIDGSSRRGLRRLVNDAGRLPFSFDELETVIATGGRSLADWGVAYAQSLGVVDHLFDRYGKRRVNDLLDAVAGGATLEDAIGDVLHVKMKTLERDAARHMKRMR